MIHPYPRRWHRGLAQGFVVYERPGTLASVFSELKVAVSCSSKRLLGLYPPRNLLSTLKCTPLVPMACKFWNVISWELQTFSSFSEKWVPLQTDFLKSSAPRIVHRCAYKPSSHKVYISVFWKQRIQLVSVCESTRLGQVTLRRENICAI